MPSAVLSIPAYLVTHGRLAGVACGNQLVVQLLPVFNKAADLSILLVVMGVVGAFIAGVVVHPLLFDLLG